MTEDKQAKTEDRDDLDALREGIEGLDPSDPDEVREAMLGIVAFLEVFGTMDMEEHAGLDERLSAIEQDIQSAQVQGLTQLVQVLVGFIREVVASEAVPTDLRGKAQQLVAYVGQVMGQQG